MRIRVRNAVAARPSAPAPAKPKPAATVKQDDYFWGKLKPSGMKEGDKVMPGLVKKAVDEGLLDLAEDQGFVTIGGDTYVVEKKKKVANPPGLRMPPRAD